MDPVSSNAALIEALRAIPEDKLEELIESVDTHSGGCFCAECADIPDGSWPTTSVKD